jgi:hypothetical protein
MLDGQDNYSGKAEYLLECFQASVPPMLDEIIEIEVDI